MWRPGYGEAPGERRGRRKGGGGGGGLSGEHISQTHMRGHFKEMRGETHRTVKRAASTLRSMGKEVRESEDNGSGVHVSLLEKELGDHSPPLGEI